MKTILSCCLAIILAVSCQMKQNQNSDDSIDENMSVNSTETCMVDTVKATAIFCIDKFASVCAMKNSLIFFPNEGFDMFRHFISHYRELYSNEKMRNRQFRHILKYPVGNSHFFVSFVTSNNFPYASNDLREASEIVIISDSMEAVKVITIIII